MSYTFKMKHKDPQALLDYGLDLADEGWLDEGETVTAYSAVCEDDNLTISSVSEAGGVIRFWAEGGIAGANYLVTVEFETSAGRIDQRTILIPVRDR